MIIFQFMFFCLVFAGIFLLFRKTPRKRKNLFSTRKMFMILAGYVGILLVSMVIYYFLPQHKMEGVEEALGSWEEAFEEGAEVYEAAHRGDFEDIPEEYLIGEKTIPYDKNTLLIQPGMLDETMAVIAIERVENEGEIQVIHYRSPYRLDGIDISHEFENTEINTVENQLILTASSPGEISYAQFTKPVILSQFNPSGHSGMGINYHAGTEAFLLKVPENIEVLQEDESFIQFLE
ncbi:hypothetical protein P6709_14430 [Jeotgalibacillus sp. ET6]|uniref:hypothetical protein n=1 Tax=Jeotgalibacillus sp. ET6 TaxID=3037260 RepID=UPI002418BB9C|nr:hypothetical protein [Jeotgalibacillus sp. ET6]MDG5472947.1 hypothetical protein [Jeotgalibacillus sp. ET6]